MHSATRSAPATGWRWPRSSTASIAGSAKSCASRMPTRICPALHGWRRYGKRSSAPRATPNPIIWSENRWFSRCSECSRKQRDNAPSNNNPDNFRHIKEFVVAKAGKKASKKKAKKARKSPPVRAGKKAAAKKATKSRRAAKKGSKAAKKTAGKVAKKAAKKAAKKVTKKSAKTAANETSVKKTS